MVLPQVKVVLQPMAEKVLVRTALEERVDLVATGVPEARASQVARVDKAKINPEGKAGLEARENPTVRANLVARVAKVKVKVKEGASSGEFLTQWSSAALIEPAPKLRLENVWFFDTL
jgi:hypothetical protein